MTFMAVNSCTAMNSHAFEYWVGMTKYVTTAALGALGGMPYQLAFHFSGKFCDPDRDRGATTTSTDTMM